MTFSGFTEFDKASFLEVARFDEATFSGDASFKEAIFSGESWFYKTTFSGDAAFYDATFSREAWFNEVTFLGAALFDRCNFDRRLVFELATFDGDTRFNYVKCADAVSLTGARFDPVPDFIGMRLRESARLDDLDIVPAKSFLLWGDKNTAARYRALKKLAIESHDHVREQDFFASEARERRGNDDPIGSAKYILGFAYEILSDFGRSVTRPLGWWLFLYAFFTSVFLLTRDLSAWLNCGPHGLLPVGKAAYLSFVNSLPFIGLGQAAQIKQISRCLYGIDVLPLGITVWSTLQTLLSTVLLFLFLLALRNYFRIK